jgi:hypothetical protein
MLVYWFELLFVYSYLLNLFFNLKTGELLNAEIMYKFKSFKQTPKEMFFYKQIGTIDFETYSDDEGKQKVRSAGWHVHGNTKLYNLGDENCSSSHELVYTLFTDILKSKFHNYTFYFHNLAMFDGILILDCLTKYDDVEMKIVMKDDNKIISFLFLFL